jgi:hypothetical protein
MPPGASSLAVAGNGTSPTMTEFRVMSIMRLEASSGHCGGRSGGSPVLDLFSLCCAIELALLAGFREGGNS